MQSLNYAFEYGELSNSQKQAVITLVEKRGKGKRQIKNWRPIALINVDARIASKTLAKRLENVLPEIIHFDQSAFVKGRTIFDAIRTTDDVIEHTMNRDISGILVAIDFEKAFDFLNFSFLIRVLHAFNFGPSFIHWVRVLYNKVFSCVMNNDFTSGPFSLSRGVRQGDPLSPYLFILALEILAVKIRNDNNVQGIRIGEKIVKLTLFADDMTCFIKDIRSYSILFETLRAFRAFSGLKVNKDKTEALALGNSGSFWQGHLVVNNLCDIIKILGVYFGGDAKKKRRTELLEDSGIN